MALGDNPRDGAVVRCKRLKKGTGLSPRRRISVTQSRSSGSFNER
jgi:hypothetical protein